MPRMVALAALLLTSILYFGCSKCPRSDDGVSQTALVENQFNVPPDTFKPVGELETEQTFEHYTVRLYRDSVTTGEGSFEILQDGKRVFTGYGHQFYIGTIPDEDCKSTKTAIGQDITGDGTADLMALG